MKKPTQKQIDKLFSSMACDVYDEFMASALVAYVALFPEMCSSASFDNAMYDKVRERLIVEFQVLYAEARGEKNVKSRIKKNLAKKKGVKVRPSAGREVVF